MPGPLTLRRLGFREASYPVTAEKIRDATDDATQMLKHSPAVTEPAPTPPRRRGEGASLRPL